MCDAGAVGAGETVLEIGPGTGVLTRELLARGARVVAVEADQRAIDALHETFRAEIEVGKVQIVHGDMRTFSTEDVAKAFGLRDQEYIVVANIPYYLSGLLFRTFLETNIQPKRIVFLVQKEVAMRIARDKKESILSLSVKAFGTPKYVRTVSKGHFNPQPRIDSAIILIDDVNRNNFNNLSSEHFFTLIHLGFGEKRKQLLGNLTKRYEREELVHIFSTLEIPSTARGEDLPLMKWLELAKKLYE